MLTNNSEVENVFFRKKIEYVRLYVAVVNILNTCNCAYSKLSLKVWKSEIKMQTNFVLPVTLIKLYIYKNNSENR